MQALPLKKLPALWLKGGNELIGQRRHIEFTLPNHKHLLKFAEALPDYTATISFHLVCGPVALWVGIESSEQLAYLSDTFKGLPLKELPAEILPVAVEAALAPLLKAIEQKLQRSFSVEQCIMGPPPAAPENFCTYFTIESTTPGNTVRGHCLLDAKGIDTLADTIRKCPVGSAPAIFSEIRFPFSLVVGQTKLSLSDYRDLALQDIVLLDDSSAFTQKRVQFTYKALHFSAKIEGHSATVMETVSTTAPTKANEKPAAPATPGAPRTPTAAAPRHPATATPPAHAPAAATAPSTPAANPVLEKLEVLLSFEVGEKQLTLAELRALQSGHTFELATSLDAPVTVKANGQAIGKGELVQINEQVGVRLVEFFAHDAV